MQTAAVVARASRPAWAARSTITMPAKISPPATGASPCSMALRIDDCSLRSHQELAAYITMDEGTKMANVAASAPKKPATCQPIRATISVLGPGAARAMANRSANSSLVNQPWTITVWCWISGMVAWPPPIDRMDSGENTRIKPSRRLADIDRPPVRKERHGDAGRNGDRDHRNHRPAQHAEHQEHRERNQRRDQITRQAPRRLDAHGERGTHARRREPREHEVDHRKMAVAAIEITET